MTRAALPIKAQGRLSPDKAWLLGFMAGDGNVGISADGGAHVSANCGTKPDDEHLAHQVADLLHELYDVPVKVRFQSRDGHDRDPYWQPILYRKGVAEDILSYGPIGTYDWRIPHEVLSRKDELGPSWLSGFFDAEGSVCVDTSKGSRYASSCSVNEVGLRQAQELFSDLGIPTSWHKEPGGRTENAMPGCYLIVCNRAALERFSALVGFRSRRKARKLARALASYQRPHANLLREQVKEALPEVLRRRACKESFEEIARAMGLATTEVPKGMVKRAAGGANGNCLICLKAKATHSIPRVTHGRAGKYACEPCLTALEPEVKWTSKLVQLKTREVAEFLDENHYLGKRGGRSAFALRNEHGVAVFSKSPQAAPLPRDWHELSRWCLTPKSKNAGSQQWSQIRRWLLGNTKATTVVSYSDPSRHDGALYRAAGWLWAPSGQFVLKTLSLSGERYPEKPYTDKNRWIYPLRPDPRRQGALTIRHPWLYNHADYKFLCDWVEPRWKRGRPTGGGKDYKRFAELVARAGKAEVSS
jgi:hypothetical protein